jgi:hypothetical protein
MTAQNYRLCEWRASGSSGQVIDIYRAGSWPTGTSCKVDDLVAFAPAPLTTHSESPGASCIMLRSSLLCVGCLSPRIAGLGLVDPSEGVVLFPIAVTIDFI